MQKICRKEPPSFVLGLWAKVMPLFDVMSFPQKAPCIWHSIKRFMMFFFAWYTGFALPNISEAIEFSDFAENFCAGLSPGRLGRPGSLCQAGEAKDEFVSGP